LYARVAWPWFALGWIGLVPWLARLDRTASWRGTLAVALSMCAAFVIGVFGWFADAIQSYTGLPWGVAFLVLVVMAPLMQPQFVTYAVARRLVRRAGFWPRAVAGACIYVGTEWAFPKLFADTIGHGFYASPLLRQAADLAGAHGLTFILVLANECALATLAVRRRMLAPAGVVAALVSALLAYGALRTTQVRSSAEAGKPVTAGVVQADLSQYDRLRAALGTYETVRLILDTHFALSTQALQRGGLDVLVWPETVYPTTFGAPKSEQGAALDREIGAYVAAAGVPLVFGAYDRDGGSEFNAAVVLEPATDGRLAFETYRKATLFPLTERVPSWLESETVRRWFPWLGTWQPGRSSAVLPLPLRDGRTLRVAPLICYDAVDPGRAIAAVRQGAELIVTLSNDSWFAAGGGPQLHLVVAAFRSLETRRPQVRATNTGISAVITPTGELLDPLGVHQRGTLVASITPERQATTLMLAWGDWFGPTALALGLLLLAATAATAPRRDGREHRAQRSRASKSTS